MLCGGGLLVADFERVARNNWQPLDETWRVLSANVIEKDAKTGKPLRDGRELSRLENSGCRAGGSLESRR